MQDRINMYRTEIMNNALQYIKEEKQRSQIETQLKISLSELLLDLEVAVGCKSFDELNVNSLTRATTNISPEDAGARLMADATKQVEIEFTPLKNNKFTVEVDALKRQRLDSDLTAPSKLVMSNERVIAKKKENKSKTQKKVVSIKASMAESTQSMSITRALKSGR
jgi:hypothetical protein